MEIRLVSSYQEIQACRRFWYQRYVIEMGRHRDDKVCVRHEEKSLIDPFDECGNLFIAVEKNSIVGTVLSTYSSQSDFGYYNELYKLPVSSSSEMTKISITNKLIIAPEYRSTLLAFRLSVETYRKGLADGILRNYIDCNEHLIPFFLKLGFVSHLGWVNHKDYGRVFSLVFHLRNEAHLKKIRSPYIKVLRRLRPTIEIERVAVG